MTFSFEPTEDYVFLYHLWKIAKQFVQYLCYRENVYLPQVNLFSFLNSKNEKQRLIHSADFYVVNEDGETELKPLKKGCYIKQIHIAGSEGKILSDIAERKIYLRHLPESYRSGNNFNAARFVLITAAFEWEFKRCYPNGVRKRDAAQNAADVATGVIESLILNSSGALKKIYKHLLKRIKDDSLQSKIKQVGKDYSTIIDTFGIYLYKLNDQKLNYSQIGERISTQRNRFAHGDLEMDFIGLSLLDVIYLQYIVYAMQLRKYDIEERRIQNIIEELFNCRPNIVEFRDTVKSKNKG